MYASLKYSIALALILVSAGLSEAAQITVLARALNDQPITGVTLRVRVFNAADRNRPVEDRGQQQLFPNTNGTLNVNVTGIVEVQLQIDDNGVGALKTATLNGLPNTAQQVIIVMPAVEQPPVVCEPVVCEPVVQYCHSRRCGLLGWLRR